MAPCIARLEKSATYKEKQPLLFIQQHQCFERVGCLIHRWHQGGHPRGQISADAHLLLNARVVLWVGHCELAGDASTVRRHADKYPSCALLVVLLGGRERWPVSSDKDRGTETSATARGGLNGEIKRIRKSDKVEDEKQTRSSPGAD
jgi:hypothetical protein